MTAPLYPQDSLRAQLAQLASSSANKFPEGRGDFYSAAITNIRDKAIPIYKNIGQSALMKDVLADKGRRSYFSYLTDHGPDHIEKVELRARQILEACRIHLTPYELYYLLAGIWLHDLGMIFGRTDHEHSIAKLLNALGDSAGDILERRVIMSVASAHSGEVPNSGGNRDTIGQLKQSAYVHSQQVREQLLAAVLRFADELADDRTRAARFDIGSGGAPSILLSGSEAFHAYASCLDSVAVKGDELTVALEFRLNEEDCRRQFAKFDGKVYLVDEIFERTKKCFVELLYCMRFIRDAPDPKTEFVEPAAPRTRPLDSVKVSVEISPEGVAVQPTMRLPYVLREIGYPSIVGQPIAVLCPDIVAAMKTWAANADLAKPFVNNCLRDGPSGRALLSLLEKAATAKVQRDLPKTQAIREGVPTAKLAERSRESGRKSKRRRGKAK